MSYGLDTMDTIHSFDQPWTNQELNYNFSHMGALHSSLRRAHVSSNSYRLSNNNLIYNWRIVCLLVCLYVVSRI